MTITPDMRHDRFMANQGQRMQRTRAMVGREHLQQFQQRFRENDDIPEWHMICLQRGCRQTIAVISRGIVGYTYTISELLTLASAHAEACHGLALTYEHYGEHFA